MPRIPFHTLIWSREHNLYELYSQGQLEQRFRPADEAVWRTWLGEVTSFAFQGASGSLNVYQEVRRGAGQYWYAYHAIKGRTRKRYLGRTARVTLACLEEAAQALSSEPAPSPPLAFLHAQPQVGQGATLLSTKLSPPRLPLSLVPRDRLQASLEGAFSISLTLLSASAGWGKTTLLSVWASRHPHQVAWLSLDSLDNEPFRFWAAVIAALRRCRPDVGTLALSMMHSSQPPAFSTLLTTLLNDLAEVSERTTPILLLLDDYQLIEDPVIQETVTFWVEHLPAHVHLLLSSRVDPELPLPRLRLRRQLLEIRTDELRFRPDEAGLFLRQAMGLSLSEEEVAALEKRTEGWVAGLQVAALSLRTQEDRSAWIAAFAGSHRYMLDYVQQEILQQLPEPIHRFLLQVAVLRRMNASICQAVTGEPASQDLLETLDRSNLFVVPLDEQRQWYRLHDLFREALLVQVQASQPQLLPLLHQRAARWYEAQGEWREAIAYALAAGDFPHAASLLERSAPSFWLSGEAQSVLTWMVALPDAVLFSHARLALDAALHLLESLHEVVSASYRRGQTQVKQIMARLQALLQSQGRSTAEPEGEERLPALPDSEMTVIHWRMRLLRALLMSREALERRDAERMRLLLQESEGLDEQEEVRWKMVSLSLTYWLISSLQRQGASMITRLLEAKRQALAALDHRAAVRVMIWLGSAYLSAGKLRLVEQECLEALALVDQIGEHTAMTGYLHLFLADSYSAWNRLEEASGSLHQVLSIAQAWQQKDLLTCGHIDVACNALARGDLAAADQALQQVETLIQQESSAFHASLVGAVRAKYWLAAGDLDQASNWAEQLVFSPQAWKPDDTVAFLVQVRVSLARGAYPQAIEALERFKEQFDQQGDIPNTIYFLATYVVALYQAGKLEQAQAVAVRLLALTEQEGDLRAYLEAGEPMKQVLQSLLSMPREQAHSFSTLSLSFVAKLVAAFEQEGKNTRVPLLAEMTPLQALALPEKGFSASPAPFEPLTQREQEVLHLLAVGASNQQIATALVIQLSTVKKHVSNLLGKLGAASRTQALAQARAVSLL